jgi:hypothetical protein
VALVKDRVLAAGALPKADAERFVRLLADLDAEKFDRRERATEDMARMGRVVEPLVRAELKKGPSLEVRVRLEKVLEKIDKGGMPGEALRPLRAVEVLEQIGTVEAREVLAALAKGSAESPLTQDAKAAEARVAKRLGK